MRDPFAAALDALFRAPGSAAANYILAGGRYSPVRVIIDQADQEVGLGKGRIVAGSLSLLIRRSEVAKPVAGEEVRLTDTAIGRDQDLVTDLRVYGEPKLDDEGLTWRCAVIPA